MRAPQSIAEGVVTFAAFTCQPLGATNCRIEENQRFREPDDTAEPLENRLARPFQGIRLSSSGPACIRMLTAGANRPSNGPVFSVRVRRRYVETYGVEIRNALIFSTVGIGLPCVARESAVAHLIDSASGSSGARAGRE